MTDKLKIVHPVYVLQGMSINNAFYRRQFSRKIRFKSLYNFSRAIILHRGFHSLHKVMK